MAEAKRQSVRSEVRDNAPGDMISENAWMGRDGNIIVLPSEGGGGEFDVPNHLLEPGWSYQWIRKSVVGNENDFQEISSSLRNGWTFYRPRADDPFFFVDIASGRDTVERGGLVLVERPEGMTAIMKERAHRAAIEQVLAVKDKFKNQNEFPRSCRPSMKLTRERIQAVPGELLPTYGKNREQPVSGE